VWISTVLTIPQDDTPTARLKMTQKPIPHACRNGAQTTIEDAIRDIPGVVSVRFGDGDGS
jgi:hypothetical protein